MLQLGMFGYYWYVRTSIETNLPVRRYFINVSTLNPVLENVVTEYEYNARHSFMWTLLFSLSPLKFSISSLRGNFPQYFWSQSTYRYFLSIPSYHLIFHFNNIFDTKRIYNNEISINDVNFMCTVRIGEREKCRSVAPTVDKC